ncbi:nucleotidyltransferase family protein [Chloroflexus sp.]|uniref:nucleotidyltransferase family protein n=1 Tax=Chloroflexus sp. TaxID=1904827 RepID=UPI002ACE75C8|nr:nucleotidyltransferase family protein [Chloroflexus sp.]
MLNAETILATLKELQPIIATRYKAAAIGLFGSFARGEQTATRDIDLLADFAESADVFDVIGLALYLEEIFQRPVDVAPKRALRAELQDAVLGEVVIA